MKIATVNVMMKRPIILTTNPTSPILGIITFCSDGIAKIA